MTNRSGKTVIKISFDTLVEEIKALLEQEGFVISGVTDYQLDFQNKLGIHFKKYKILTVHHPGLFFEMLAATTAEGMVLPSSIMLIERYPGEVEVSVFNPMSVVARRRDSAWLETKAEEISLRLDTLIHKLEREPNDMPDLVTSWS